MPVELGLGANTSMRHVLTALTSKSVPPWAKGREAERVGWSGLAQFWADKSAGESLFDWPLYFVSESRVLFSHKELKQACSECIISDFRKSPNKELEFNNL